MSIQELESAIADLPPEDLAKFARWFEEYLADAWDAQIEKDIAEGRLDSVGRKADAHFDAGRCDAL